MKSLLIETSTEEGICALYSCQGALFHSNMPKGFQHSRYLISEIDRGFTEQKLSIDDLSFIAIGVGPGSYTGMRVGAMVAKTFSWLTKIPLVPILSLEGIAPLEDGPFIAALDAKISGAYVLFGERKGKVIEYAALPEVISLEVLSERICAPITIVSPHTYLLEKKWKEKNLRDDVFWMERRVEAEFLISIACDRFQKGITVNDRTLELQYLRNSI